MRRLLFGMSVFLYTNFAAAKINEICKVCSSYRSVDVCLVAAEFGSRAWIETLRKNSVPSACGAQSERYYIDGFSDMHSALSRLGRECKRISKLVFLGHGRTNQIKLGEEIDSSQWKDFAQYSCLLNEGAMIDTRSCNSGSGCDGALQMYRIAKAFLGQKNGTILSPTQYIAAVGRPHALFAKDRLFKYAPKGQSRFELEGTGTEISSEVTRQCREQVGKIAGSVKAMEEEFGNDSCLKKMPPRTFCLSSETFCPKSLSEQRVRLANVLGGMKSRGGIDLLQYLNEQDSFSSIVQLEKSVHSTEGQLAFYCASRFSKWRLRFEFDKFMDEPSYVPRKGLYPSGAVQ